MDDHISKRGLDAPRRPMGDVLRGPGTTGFAARLERWVADARVDEDAMRRARERWLQDVAQQEATFSGVLADLAERRAPVTLETTAGRRHHGVVHVIGADFAALRVRSSLEVLVALGAIDVVRTSLTVDAPLGDRMLSTELRLVDVLARLAADRERAMLVTRRGDQAVTGELRSVGHDVVVVRIEGEDRGTTYVPIAAISEVCLG
ncbi:MAG: hypothetical protein ACRDYW_00090 [Acidimicrobiales bacterium]